jgi:hypothetical protein
MGCFSIVVQCYPELSWSIYEVGDKEDHMRERRGFAFQKKRRLLSTAAGVMKSNRLP